MRALLSAIKDEGRRYYKESDDKISDLDSRLKKMPCYGCTKGSLVSLIIIATSLERFHRSTDLILHAVHDESQDQ